MFHGSMVALVTPMFNDERIDFDSLSELVEWHIADATDVIVAVGTTGESATLTNQEKLQVIRAVVQQVNERIPVIAGSSAVGTNATIELTRAAMEQGADACLIMTPPYVKPTQEGLYKHYRAIAHAVAIPQIMYNVPGRTACDLLPETVARLSTISNIIGIKEASGDITRVSKIINMTDGAVDVYSGDDSLTKDMILQGAKGVISVVANIAPRAVHDMCQAALAHNDAAATIINDKLASFYKALFVESNPIPVKWAMERLGKIKPGIRLPLTLLSQEYYETVEQAMREAEVLSD